MTSPTRFVRLILVSLVVWGLLGRSSTALGQDAEPRPTSPSMEIGQVKAHEGSDFFTIEVFCHVRTRQEQAEQQHCQVPETSAQDHIRVEPEVTFQVVSGSDRFRLIGAFAPRTTYTLTFLPGLSGGNHQVLREQVVKTVETSGLTPRLTLLGRARYLPRLHGATLPFEARNVTEARVSFRHVWPQNLVFWLTKNQEAASPDVAEEVHHTTLRLQAKPDAKISGEIDLDVLDRLGQGVFQVTVQLLKDGKPDQSLDSATLVITDLVGIAKQDRDDLYVWTRAAADMRARPGVYVRVMSYSNRELASCTTRGDDAGCVLPGIMRQPHKPYALLLSAGNDLSYLRFSDVEIVDQDAREPARPFTEEDAALEAYVYSSRGVYRPGETVNLAAVVWTASHQAAHGIPLQWQILTSRNKVLKEVSMSSSRFGLATLDVSLDDYAPTGKYQAVLKSGAKHLQTYGFFVEDFVPERIGLQVSAAQQVFVGAEQMARFEVAAHYLFGPPVAGGTYTARCTLEPAGFTVPDQPEFATGRYLQQPPRPVVLEPLSGSLDAQGQAAFTCDYAQYLGHFPTIMRVRADVEVSEAGSGRVTLKSAAALVSATGELLGLRTLGTSGGKIHVEGRLFTPTGKAVRRDAQVEVSLHRVLSNWIYAWDPRRHYYRWQREEILIPAGGAQTVEAKAGRFEMQLQAQDTYGAYVVRGRIADAEMVADLKVALGYAWLWQTAGRGGTPKPRSPDRLDLILSQDEADGGDQLSVRFEAPFDGYALFAVETDRLLTSRWVSVRKGPQELPFVAPDVLPNVYVTVLLLKDPVEDEFYVPARAWGSASLRLRPRPHTMQIAVTAPEVMRPQQEVQITLQATPAEPAQFTVAVVDEGILQLTDFATPDPLAAFFQPRQLGVHTYETVGWTFARAFDPRRDPGGGRGQLPGKKPPVIPVTIVSRWTGVVDANPDGSAVVRVPIPQFQGKVRIMVVGASQHRTGSAEGFVTIRDPLVLQATMPRFLTWNDRFSIPVFVVNTTGEPQQVKVEVQGNEALELERTSDMRPLADGASQVFRFPARVTGFAGTARLIVQASGGRFTTRDVLEVPIKPFTPEQTVAVTVPAGESIALADHIPAALRPEELRLEVSVSTIPFLQELGRLRSLLHYPYGCIEQTTSGTFPLLYLSDLMIWADPEALQEHDVSDMVYAGINRLLSMQTTSGGFAYWPGHNDPTLWGTAYVTHLLLKARELGYDVPSGAIQDALDFMQGAVTSRRYRYDRKYRLDLAESEPYMLYVLGLAGRHQQGRLRQLAQQPPQWGKLRLENTFLLMLAYDLAGEHLAARQFALRKALLQPAALSGRHYSRTFWSGLRTDAMRLSLAEDRWPGDPALEPLTQKVAQALRTRRYLTTQETSWSVSGLGKRARLYRGVDLAGVGLQLDGHPIEPTMRHNDVPVWMLSGYDFADLTLRVTHTSETPPFVTITMQGYARDYTVMAAQGLPFTLSRRYLDLQGQPLSDGTLAQGDLAVVELSIASTTPEDIPNVALVDRLPAGLEIENPRLGREHRFDWMPDQEEVFAPDYVDVRDDRIQVFGTLPRRVSEAQQSVRRFYYVVRAVTPGTFAAPPARLEVMYDPEKVDYTDYASVVIEPR
jgi:uncharacterized protein YfaS (alpha-2-macroglobulin family)